MLPKSPLLFALLLLGCRPDPPATCVDEDGDGYGVGEDRSACTFSEEDCDDSAYAISPAGTEVCDGADNDCDGTTDESDAADASTFYVDADGDGYGDSASAAVACEAPEGYADSDDDCDDDDEDSHPGATEVCDGADNDCDGTTDESDAEDAPTWYLDADGDGHGDPDHPQAACEAPTGYVEGGEDCDDSDAAVHPDAEEICGDGIDNDCDDSAAACLPEGDLALASSCTLLLGEDTYDHAGFAVAGAGDTNGDGYADLLVGAIDAEPDGAAYLLAGPVTADQDLGSATARFSGTDAGSMVAKAVAGAGDVDGDGFDDLLIGSEYDDTAGLDAGAAYLFSGPASGEVALSEATAVLLGESGDDHAGTAVTGAGDTDGDGHDDLLVGAPRSPHGGSYAGAAYLVRGPVSGDFDLGEADARIAGEGGSWTGHELDGAGDTNGDGYADILLATAETDEQGAAYLLLGPLSGETDTSEADAALLGEEDGDRAGYAVAGAGDANADGYDDLLVGAWYDNTGGTHAGAAYLVLGPVSGDFDLGEAEAKLVGEREDNAGESLAGAGDLNLDGYDDLLVGAYLSETEEGNVGAVYVVYGPVSGERELSTEAARLYGDEDWGYAGQAVAGAGDVDGNGWPDLLVGAPYAGPSEYEQGVVYLFRAGL